MMHVIQARPSCLAPAPSGVGIRRKFMEGIYQGDALSVLPTLPAASIQTCVTSPPYFGLRDYGVAGQIGLEETPEAFTQKLVEVFREVRRVLRDDGTLWLNLGDSYNTQQAGNKTPSGFSQTRPSRVSGNGDQETVKHGRGLINGLKPKDLIGIPWRVAFALQADGWYLRQDIIWHKPNPMPESVTDRCTKAHEYIFLLSKSPKYYFDHESIKEPAVMNRWGGKKPMNLANSKDTGKVFGGLTRERDMMPETRNKRSVWTVTTKPYKGAHFATFPSDLIEPCILAGSKPGDFVLDPFLGSGTTAAVAKRFSRNYVGIELNPAYIALAEERLKSVQLPLIAAE